MVIAHLDVEHPTLSTLQSPIVDLWQVDSGIEVPTKLSKQYVPTTLIYTPDSLAVLNFHSFFPDLYFIQPEYECSVYQTFLKYSLFRMGLKEHEL
jgi:hypothetical protein